MNSMESSSLIGDQSISPGKQMKKTPQNVNNNNNNNNLHQIGRVCSNNIPRQANKLSQNNAKAARVMHEYDNMMMMMMMHGGLYLNNQQHAPYHHHHHHHHHHQLQHLTNSFPLTTMSFGHGQQQPALLPFPPAVSRPAFPSQPPLRRSQSLSPPIIVPRKAPAKNKTPPPIKKENQKGIHNNSVEAGKSSNGPTKNENGPTDLTRVFRMAPPPSSLPLPRFTLRKTPPPPPPPTMKLRCNAEAAATDNICILLRLR